MLSIKYFSFSLLYSLITQEEAPVLILEAESADLSLVLVSLAQMILNPDSRTLHGFQVRGLISRSDCGPLHCVVVWLRARFTLYKMQQGCFRS